MRRALLLLVVALLAFGSAQPAGADPPLLIGTDGPGFTIDLTDANNQHVDVLTAGTYTLLVHDQSDIHNFALGDATTNTRLVTTGIEFVGDQTYTLELSPGSYVYACSAHFQTMFGTFRVVAAPPPAVPTITAKVTGTAVSLSPKSVKPGTYRVRVADRTRNRNFHLLGPGVNRKTGKGYTGSVTWTVALSAGTYRFGSDPRLTGRLVVG